MSIRQILMRDAVERYKVSYDRRVAVLLASSVPDELVSIPQAAALTGFEFIVDCTTSERRLIDWTSRPTIDGRAVIEDPLIAVPVSAPPMRPLMCPQATRTRAWWRSDGDGFV